jgi:hypothetical protein
MNSAGKRFSDANSGRLSGAQRSVFSRRIVGVNDEGGGA